MSNQYVLQVQKDLQAAGLYDGAIDGLFGKGTFAAINKLISKAGIKQADRSEASELADGYVTKNFKLSELTHSNTAVSRGMSNQPTAEHKKNLIAAATNLFQPVRDLLGKPMVINSGYRSDAVNKAVGGSKTSAHSYGYAIDFVSPKYGNTRQIAAYLAKELKARGIKFDQLILEFPDSPSSWIHLGYKDRSGRQRGQVLTAKKVNGRTVYTNGLS